METKWVTLAIRTYYRAEMIKAVLEQNNIETVIHNLNTENPEVAVGVRVRIKEQDLPKALSIVEEVEKEWDKEKNTATDSSKNKILIPIELTENIKEVCKFGFKMAEDLNAEVVFLNAYFTPAFTITPNTTIDFDTYSLTNSETLRRLARDNKADSENLTNLIQKWVDMGELPEVDFSIEIKAGIPEDVIYDYCKENKPMLVIMSNNNKIRKEENRIGSITAEILETVRVPVIALPYHQNVNPDNIKSIAFFTNFDHNDLVAIDTIISYFKKEDLELIFLHTTDQKDKWEEVMLEGIKSYFANHYPNLKTDYAFLKSSKEIDKLNAFLKQKKIDMIAINRRKRSLISRFFNQGFASRMLFNVDTPLFVLRK